MCVGVHTHTHTQEDAEATEPAPPPSKKSKKGQQASSSSKKDAQKAARAKADAAVSALESTKVDFLVRVGLLQSVAPRETQFVITNAAPLPDELLTTVQVRHVCVCMRAGLCVCVFVCDCAMGHA